MQSTSLSRPWGMWGHLWGQVWGIKSLKIKGCGVCGGKRERARVHARAYTRMRACTRTRLIPHIPHIPHTPSIHAISCVCAYPTAAPTYPTPPLFEKKVEMEKQKEEAPALVKCLDCAFWSLRGAPKMAAHGFGACAKKNALWDVFSGSWPRECRSFGPLAAAEVQKRAAWLQRMEGGRQECN